MSQKIVDAPPGKDTGANYDESSGGATQPQRRSWMTRGFVGFMAALLAVISVLGAPALQPRANAQLGAAAGVAGLIAGAKTAQEICDAVYGKDSGGIRGCLEKFGDDIKEGSDKFKDFQKCMESELKKPADEQSGDRPSSTETPSGGDGGDNAEDKDKDPKKSALETCIDKAKEDDKDKEKDQPEAPPNLSLYRMGSALTAFYANNLIPGGADSVGGDSSSSDSADSQSGDDKNEDSEAGKGLEAWKSLLGNPGTAGAFLAAPNSDFQESYKWLFGAGGGVNDATLSYDSVARDDQGGSGSTGIAGMANAVGGNGGAPDAGVAPYGQFGATLAGLGFDSTQSKGSASAAVGSVGGVLMMAAYVAAGAVDTVFDTLIELLQTLNPFRLITGNLTEHSGAKFDSGMPSAAEGENGAFEDLRNFIGDMYAGFVDLGWLVTVPIFMGFTIMAILMSRRYNAGDGLKKLGLRMLFIGLGVPLLGVTYTGALESMQGASGNSAKANAAKIVMSTYVDFEGWSNTRLTIPNVKSQDESFAWDITNNTPDEKSQARVRSTALGINGLVAKSQNEDGLARVLDDGNSRGVNAQSDSDKNWASSQISERGNRGLDNASAKVGYERTLDMLRRYVANQKVSSSDYEGRVKGAIQKWASAGGTENNDRNDAARSWVEDYTNSDSLNSMDKDSINEMANPLLQVGGKAALNSSSDGHFVRFRNATGDADANPGQCAPHQLFANVNDVPKNTDSFAHCNLSPLTMYNYLNTSFGPTSMRMFSPDNSTSNYQREEHNSVTPVGSGLMQYVYWFSAMTLLVSFAIIGFLYALTMVFNSIKRGIQLIAAIPFGLMGFVAGIAKAVIYTIAMFLEIFLTLFTYKVVQEFMMAIPSLIEKPLVDNLSENNEHAKAGVFGILGGAAALGVDNPATIVLVVTLVSSIGIIIFTLMAIKLRSSITSAMEEAVTNAINKIVGTGVSSGRSHGPNGLQQGLARGVGLGATHAMMNGGGGDAGDVSADKADVANASNSAGGGNGAAAVPAAFAAGGLGGTALGDGIGGDGADGIADADSVGAEGAEIQNASYSGDGGAIVDGDQVGGGQDYDIDGDGGIVDADGQPAMIGEGEDTRQATINDVADFDPATGQLLGPDGQPVLSENGQPITQSDIHGINKNGSLTDAEGAPILDSNGSEIKAQNISNPDGLGGQGGDVDTSHSADSDQAIADQLANNGGLDYSGAADSSDGLPATSVSSEGANISGNAVGDSVPVASTGGVSGINHATDGVTQAAEKFASSDAAAGTGAGAIAGAIAGHGGAKSLSDNMRTMTGQLDNQMAQIKQSQAGHSTVDNLSHAIRGEVPQAGAPTSGGQSQPVSHGANYNNVASTHDVPQRSVAGGNNDALRMVAAGAAGSMVTRSVSNFGHSQSRTMNEAVTGGRNQQGSPQSGGGQSARNTARHGRKRSGMSVAGGQAAGVAAQSMVLGQHSGAGQHTGQSGQGTARRHYGMERGNGIDKPGGDGSTGSTSSV